MPAVLIYVDILSVLYYAVVTSRSHYCIESYDDGFVKTVSREDQIKGSDIKHEWTSEK